MAASELINERIKLCRYYKGEKKNLLDIFAEWAEKTGSKCVIPPSGSGECCAPKLLQYAYLKGLKPVEIAEVTLAPNPVPSPARGKGVITLIYENGND